jgi:Methyltransferase domain
MKFGIYQFYSLFQPALRKRRFELFVDAFRPTASTRILDVGGYVYDWTNAGLPSTVTCLNVDPVSWLPPTDRVLYQAGDGRNMKFADQSFDVVFSNSVIEHVGAWEDQQRFAAEVRRVGRQIFVQTPNRWFFIETHFVTLLVHYLPWPLAKRIIPFCSFRGFFRHGDNANLKALADELRLLSFRQVKELFPDCEIHREKLFGLTKSFIAIRRDPPKA